MTDEELAQALTEVAALARDTTPGVMAMFALAERVGKERPEFAGPVRMIMDSRHFSSETVVQRMLSLVRDDRRTAQEAVEWFRTVSVATRVVGGALKLLYGVTCTEPIQFSDDVALLPFAQIPKSATLTWVMKEHERANDARLLHGYTALPQAALYRAGTIEPLFRTTIPEKFEEAPPASWFIRLDQAAQLLTLSPKAVAIEVTRWFHCDDPNLELLVQSGLTRQQQEFYSPFRVWAAPTTIEPAATAGTLTLFRRLGRPDQQRLSLALQRLLKSRAQLNIGNRAIDLAIALEVIFMGPERGKRSWKISSRLAGLLGGSPEEQQTAFAETRRVYEMRSQMVHTGTADNEYEVGGQVRSAYDLIEATDLRCTLAIRKFLETVRIPSDWREIELGFGAPPNPETSS